MNEEEKIFAGKLFDARTKELRNLKHKAHELSASSTIWMNMIRKGFRSSTTLSAKSEQSTTFRGLFNSIMAAIHILGRILLPISI